MLKIPYTYTITNTQTITQTITQTKANADATTKASAFAQTHPKTGSKKPSGRQPPVGALPPAEGQRQRQFFFWKTLYLQGFFDKIKQNAVLCPFGRRRCFFVLKIH